MFFQGSDFLGISLRIDSMERGGKKKKLPLVSGSESWRFSAAPSNYNNELRRSNATPRHPEKQARDSSTEGPSPPRTPKKLNGMVLVPGKFGGARICAS